MDVSFTWLQGSITLVQSHSPSNSQLPSPSSFILFKMSSIIISSGTSSPFSTISFAFNPTSVPSLIWERSTSPLDKWVTENVFTILSETVPLPDPGGPMMRARTGFDAILVKWMRRHCVAVPHRTLRINRRFRTFCILKIWKFCFESNSEDWAPEDSPDTTSCGLRWPHVLKMAEKRFVDFLTF